MSVVSVNFSIVKSQDFANGANFVGENGVNFSVSFLANFANLNANLSANSAKNSQISIPSKSNCCQMMHTLVC